MSNKYLIKVESCVTCRFLKIIDDVGGTDNCVAKVPLCEKQKELLLTRQECIDGGIMTCLREWVCLLWKNK